MAQFRRAQCGRSRGGVRLSEPDISSDWGSLAKIHTLLKSISCARVRQAKKTGILALPHYCHDNAATTKGSRPCPKRWPDVEHRMSLADHDRPPESVGCLDSPRPDLSWQITLGHGYGRSDL